MKTKRLDELILEIGGLTNNIQLLRTSIDELTKEIRSTMIELAREPVATESVRRGRRGKSGTGP